MSRRSLLANLVLGVLLGAVGLLVRGRRVALGPPAPVPSWPTWATGR